MAALVTDLDELARRWRTAEERLYPSLMAMEPGRYEGYLTTVRAIADELHPYVTREALAEAYTQRSGLLDLAAGRLGRGADPELVVDAAFNMRSRQVAEQSRRSDMRRRIAEAGPGWVTIWERAGAELELHVPSGAGLHAWVEEDVDTGNPRYAVQVLRLDPETGEPDADAAPPDSPLTFEEPGAWQRARERLRQELG